MPRNLACGLLTAGICFRMSLPIVIGHSPVAVEFDTHIQPGMTLLVNPLGSKKCPKYCRCRDHQTPISAGQKRSTFLGLPEKLPGTGRPPGESATRKSLIDFPRVERSTRDIKVQLTH